MSPKVTTGVFEGLARLSHQVRRRFVHGRRKFHSCHPYIERLQSSDIVRVHTNESHISPATLYRLHPHDTTTIVLEWPIIQSVQYVANTHKPHISQMPGEVVRAIL